MKLNKFYKFLFLLSFLMLYGPYPVYSENPGELDTRELLKRITTPNENLNFRGTEIHILIGNDGVPTIKKFSVGRKGGGFARTQVEGESQPNEIYIKNRHGAWIYYPGKNKLVRKKQTFEKEKKFSVWRKDKFKLIQANYEIKFIKNNNIAGRACVVYSFRPKEKGRLMREFWIDTLSGFPLRIDIFEPNGRLLNISSFEAIEFNPKFPQDFFKSRFLNQVQENKPQAIDVVLVPYKKLKESMGNNVRFPGYIPKGYWLSNVFVQKKKHGERYHMIYSDGIVPLSIFQEELGKIPSTGSPEGGEALSFGADGRGYFKQKGIVKILCFTTGNSKNTIVGEVDKNEMVKIAESLYPIKGGITK